jgi:lactoylglutathione lyase
MPIDSQSFETPIFGWCILYVDNVESAARFYAEALGLAVRFAHESGTYTELETGATTLALCDRASATESSGFVLDRANSPTATASNITLIYSDVEARWTHALQHGAQPVSAPVAKPWGQTCAYVRDPDGHLIELATAIDR